MKCLPKSPFPPGLAPILDNRLRKCLINRESFLREIGVGNGDAVLEVGCGPGFFTETLSAIVGERGKVYAQDVEGAMLDRLEKKLGSLAYRNVVLLHCNSSAIELPDTSCDVVLCLNVLEEIHKEGQLEESVREVDRVLKPGGFVVIKEHRFGGTAPIIGESETLLLRAGYGKVSQKRTILSYHSKLIKGQPVDHSRRLGSSPDPGSACDSISEQERHVP